MAGGKRKRDILDFDPNKSDSDDENFEPEVDRPRSRKKTRPHGTNKSSSTRGRRAKYRGSDIDDDELDDSVQENSFGEEDLEDDEPEPPINENTGRRVRKAATKHQNYKESSDEDDLIQDSDEEKDDLIKEPPKKSPRQRKLITLKVPPQSQSQSQPQPQLRKTRTASNAAAPIGIRRVTRARTVEAEDELVELSNSGRHARPARGSKSKSPEALGISGRPTRSGKGIKKTIPTVIEEDIQEESKPSEAEAEAEAEADAMQDPITQDVGAAEEGTVDQVDDTAQDAPHEEEEPIETVEKNDAMEVDDEDDDVPVARKTRSARANQAVATTEDAPADDGSPVKRTRGRLTRKSRFGKSLQEPSSDFEPGNESGEENESDSDARKGGNGNDAEDNSSPSARGRRSSRGKGRRSARRSQRRSVSGDEDEVDENEVAEELRDLRQDSRSRRERRSPQILFEKKAETRRRRGQPVNYAIAPLNAFTVEQEEDDDDPAPTPARRRGRANGGGGWDHSLHTTAGALGGVGLVGSLLGGPWGTGAAGGVDSDSSDDEMNNRSGMAGIVGMTPTSAAPPGPSLTNAEGGGLLAPAPNVGRIKNPKALADADPLGVDMNVDFSHVGGLQGHIDQLKEMVQLPLLYPELFTRFHVTPPRGVLFHGPPGTGKTLLARALANTAGIGGRKITFYMRKGADALSKWVGEAEKQLRLLFEEARRTQPSIIFFDEIDGLAPVRSSKQEQIHASIVSTLLALMDGMDGRGQVIVIGATNRPDSVDPALRRPGRFDREFYFPLPDVDGRKAIIDIHTKDWGLTDEFKMSLAKETKGYGGADLRAMCTEAALNAIQRTYPQIYMSKEKLVVNPEKINIHMTDFMLSKNKIVPSSERSAVSGAAPFPKPIEPLLREQFKTITSLLDSVFPRKKKVTALDEAMFEPYDDEDFGFGREALQQEFHRFRVYRPRLLICGSQGMGQVYISAAILHYLEGVNVQNFDIANILGDPLPAEQVMFGLFAEARRHKPSVIFIPHVDMWYETLAGPALTAFMSMLRTIQPTDSIMVIGTSEKELDQLSFDLKHDLFGWSNSNFVEIARPAKENRREYFDRILSHIRRLPKDFPDPTNRKKRVLEALPVAPPPPPKQMTKEELETENLLYRKALNLLKIHLQPIMDQIKRKYKAFRSPIIPLSQYQYLFDEANPNYVRPDVADAPPRPYVISQDSEGAPGLLETATGKFYYNLDTVTIETRLAHGYYVNPWVFLKDCKSFVHDAKNLGDKGLWLKADELATNVSVDVSDINDKLQRVDWDAEWRREQYRKRELKRLERAKKREEALAKQNGEKSQQGPQALDLHKSHTTTAHFQVIGEETTTNGESSLHHDNTNGTSIPSRALDDDATMTDIDSQPPPGGLNLPMQPPSQWPRMSVQSLNTSVQATAGGTNQLSQLSQTSAVQSLPPGVSPSALINDASTTKTSDPSNRSSNFSTQATNGTHHDQSSPGDNLPDTQPYPGNSQGASSDEQWPHSQAHGLLRGYIPQPGSSHGSRAQASPAGGKSSHAPSMANLLNDAPLEEPSQSQSHRQSGVSSASQQVELDDSQAYYFLEMLTERTSGCTIEQLQHIYREMMVELWRTRGEHNRMKVLHSITRVFNEAINEIESMQGMLQPSQ
ncbi:AAA-domain-containing protein [Daldinia caldariorum]|uniref:AAA-domain-containing protein n=1 Tax=Daldinia caldariorum TaxID=326644 RepID=UPI002007B975|nr:AAA-domain-containing protein [Daldinia caldariorum]KAI1468254.1 AAA-domain-containing protein [Daldinia caldariorum]